tara:strand:- start:28033 stop:29742 length:1710 start_codon:yes stop_codon:yes gene_type:complete
MIYFKKLRWRNFLSTGNQFIEVDMNKSASTLIIGKNGSGKSTLLDALCFVLFNRPFRNIKKEQLVNSINNNDCEIQCEFSIGNKEYKIIRGIKPNIFDIYCNGELLNQDASTIDYQKTLEQNIMKLNYRSFIQVVILGSSSYEPFMHLRARHRREVVEEILDIRVFTHMDILLRQKQAELNKSVTDVSHRYDLMKEKFELQNNHFIQLQNRDESDITERKDKIKQDEQDKKLYNDKLTILNEKIVQNKIELVDEDKAKEDVNTLAKLEAKIETNLLNHKKNLEFFENNSKCPTCTQDIGVELRTEKLAEEKARIIKLETGLKELLNEIIKTETKVNEYAKINEHIGELGIEIAKIDTSITELNRHSTRIQEEINKLTYDTTNTESIQMELSVIKVQLTEIESEKDRVVNDKKYIDIAREILNDTGVKANIIKKYLPIMNQLINEHLQQMDFFVNFHLNEEFEETIKSRNRDTFNYNNFSEGEKMRIDLALLFTWRNIAKLKNSVNTNILILDEIFDSSLDGQGTDDFFKILKSLQKENVFIISHKGDIMFDKFTNIIKFEKHQNFTRLA